MFMFPLKIINGNEHLLITNRTELEKFIAFAQLYLSLPIMSEGEENRRNLDQHKPNPETEEQASTITPVANSNNHLQVKEYNGNSVWLKKAWDAVGQPLQGATNRELYDAARKLGYASTAKDAIPAFKTAIRVSPHMERVALRDNIALWKWTDTPNEKRKKSPTRNESIQGLPSAYQGPSNQILRHPPEGERAIDYAVRGLQKAGRPLTTQQLADIMYGLGWKPSGNALDTLASTLRKSRYGDIVVNIKGFWVLIGDQSVSGEPISSEPDNIQNQISGTNGIFIDEALMPLTQT